MFETKEEADVFEAEEEAGAEYQHEASIRMLTDACQ